MTGDLRDYSQVNNVNKIFQTSTPSRACRRNVPREPCGTLTSEYTVVFVPKIQPSTAWGLSSEERGTYSACILFILLCILSYDIYMYIILVHIGKCLKWTEILALLSPLPTSPSRFLYLTHPPLFLYLTHPPLFLYLTHPPPLSPIHIKMICVFTQAHPLFLIIIHLIGVPLSTVLCEPMVQYTSVTHVLYPPLHQLLSLTRESRLMLINWW